MISVITATYNRGGTLNELYHSLVSQTCKDFEWVVIDDGSVDNTKDIMKKLISEYRIDIKYSYQDNSGKHVALNNAIKLAKGDLIFFVDSDDTLTMDCIEFILSEWVYIKDNKQIAGLSGNKAHMNGGLVGTTFNGLKVNVNSFDFRYKLKIKGDKAEIFKKEIIEKYPFPHFIGEKFIPEAIVFNRIANDGYIIAWINKIIYLCDYREDGLTKQGSNIFANSWYGFSLYVREMLIYPNVPFIMKFKLLISYIIHAIKFKKNILKLISVREKNEY